MHDQSSPTTRPGRTPQPMAIVFVIAVFFVLISATFLAITWPRSR